MDVNLLNKIGDKNGCQLREQHLGTKMDANLGKIILGQIGLHTLKTQFGDIWGRLRDKYER